MGRAAIAANMVTSGSCGGIRWGDHPSLLTWQNVPFLEAYDEASIHRCQPGNVRFLEAYNGASIHQRTESHLRRRCYLLVKAGLSPEHQDFRGSASKNRIQYQVEANRADLRSTRARKCWIVTEWQSLKTFLLATCGCETL